MNRIEFTVRGQIRPTIDAAYLLPHEDAHETFKDAVIETISTDVMVKVGEVEMHLAAWFDPDHWEDDWRSTHDMSPEDVHSLLESAAATA